MSNTGAGLLTGKWPAEIVSYDADSRTCQIIIPGQTDGAETPLVAEIEYPIGDKSRHATMTEIEILPGDMVWVEFIQGDPRFPLITGWRNPTRGNSSGWRRWHHQNIESLADGLICEKAGQDKRIQAGGDIQTKSGENILHSSAASFKVKAGDRVQIEADGIIVIQSSGGSIVLKSSTGTLTI